MEIGNRPTRRWPQVGGGRQTKPARHRAFTLIELMLSLAMVLILIVGINFVFRSASDAVGAGQTLNAINADAQSAQPTLFNDLRNVAKNPPLFIISSQLVTQFQNADDAKTSSDPTVIPIDNAGNYAAIWAKPNPAPAGIMEQLVSPAILSNRSHRADTLQFIAHGLYQRRTGNDGSFYGSESGQDAYIQICHAALPINAQTGSPITDFMGPTSTPNSLSGVVNGGQYGTFTGPQPTAPIIGPGIPRTGAYASDWVLARRVVLLKDPSTITAGDVFYKAQPAAPNNLSNETWANMTPLGYNAPDSVPATVFESSRYDIAGITPEQLDRAIATAILGWQNFNPPAQNYSGFSLWWNPLVYSFAMFQQNNTPPLYSNSTTTVTPPYSVPYCYAVPSYSLVPFTYPTYDPGLWYNRPECNPKIQSPLTAAMIAQMSPYFLQHCSQFIVEYAGDYIQQDNNPSSPTYSDMTGIGSDGQIDYYLDANGNKHIRWYGFPRSSTGVPHLDMPPGGAGNPKLVLIRGYDPKGTGGSPADSTGTHNLLNYFTDVIPLRDYYSMWINSQSPATPANLYAPPWEVDVNFDPAHDYGEYWNASSGSINYIPKALNAPHGNANAFAQPNAQATAGYPFFLGPNAQFAPRYVAAWHDDMPAMIRILIKVDDPNNQVKDGPWYEYVFRLK